MAQEGNGILDLSLIHISTAVSSGTVFTKFREKTLEGGNTNAGWAEWSVEKETDPKDREAWYETNPSLGVVLTERKILDEIGSDTIDFNIQRLGYWIRYNQKSAISKAEWEELKAGKKPELTGSLFVGIKYGHDGNNAVSYTHLDVYKRQAPVSEGIISWFTPSGNGERGKNYDKHSTGYERNGSQGDCMRYGSGSREHTACLLYTSCVSNTWWISSALYLSGETQQEILRIDGNRLRRLKELNGGMWTLEWLRYEPVSYTHLLFINFRIIHRYRNCSIGVFVVHKEKEDVHVLS